jgi:hypothetical protein
MEVDIRIILISKWNKKRFLWPFSGAKTAGNESVWDGPFFTYG